MSLLALGVLSASVLAGPAAGHRVYLANENHTDYGWNASTEAYDDSMLNELDYYLDRIAATAADPPAAQARFVADSWYYLYLYETRRSPQQFQRLLGAMASGHITVPLNPLVTLYGALPTEAAIRAGYYPGRIERLYGAKFVHGEEMENATIPWGMAGIWARSGAKYSWKGICGCVTSAPYADRSLELFRWQAPDGSELLTKWYRFSGDNRSWGGYAEARALLSQSGIAETIARDTDPAHQLPVSGVFGYGWDDVTSQTSQFETEVAAWNAAHPGGDQAFVSNIVDYFHDVEQNKGSLPVLRGGWGNDWDLLPATLAQRTSSLRRSVEQLRTAEADAAIVHGVGSTGFWASHQGALSAAWIDFFKYFEHTWTDGGMTIPYVVNNKIQWQQQFTQAVVEFQADAAASLSALVQVPDEDRFLVFNPLGFSRTDYADLPIDGSGPYVVTDVATGAEALNQVVTLGGKTYLRILARDIPSLGYRVYRYGPGKPTAAPDAASVVGNRIESDRYRVVLGTRGELTSAFNKSTAMEMAGGGGLNDFGSGTSAGLGEENAGPVSVTLRQEIAGPPQRRVRVTLVKDVDRIVIDDEILEHIAATSSYDYHVNLTSPQIRFEEVGAIARPGLATAGGDFLAGTRADHMTLNHFVSFAEGGAAITLSNWDAFAMRVGHSTETTFDLSTPEVSILALGNLAYGGITDQGGDSYFEQRFALQGGAGPVTNSQAMQMSLAHQNPLQAIALPRNQSGPLVAPIASFLSVDAPNVVVTAFKPADEGNRGWVVRLWELDGAGTQFNIDASAFSPTAAYEVSLIETDVAPVALKDGVIRATIDANQIKAYRFVSTVDATPTPAPVTPTPELIRGDLDGDGHITATDLAGLIAALFLPSPPPQADVNADGATTSCDLSELIRQIGTR